MDKDRKFYRKVYLILIAILLLAIISQISRSQYILKMDQNEQQLNEHQQIVAKLADGTGLPGSGWEPGIAGSEGSYCLVYQSDDELSMELTQNTVKTLDYMKQPYNEVDLASQQLKPNECAAMLLTTDFIALSNADVDFGAYVEEGGYVFLMRMSYPEGIFQQLYRNMGIVNFRSIEPSYGTYLTSNVLIGQKGLATGQDFIYNSSLQLELDDEAEVLAESLHKVPLMWKRDYGKGAFLVYNGDNLYVKTNRGLIAGGISLMQPDYIYPIFNVKLFYIDDFPAPFREHDDNIYAEYRRDLPTFFRDIWWPEMLKSAKKYNVQYTAVSIQTYNDQIEPPFENPEGEDRHSLISYGREVIKSGGEIGIHGYNHQSLQMDKKIADSFKYHAWKSPADMEASIKETLQYLEAAFPNYQFMSYVPPSNVLGPEGRTALKKAWPELAVVASLYNTDATNRAYVQEFEIAPDGVIELPRITSGYFDTPYNIWAEANTVTSLGVFSHFLHPDDLLEEERSMNQNWEKLYEDFDDMLERLNTTFPWLRSITSTEAGLDVGRQLQTQIQVEREPRKVAVRSTADSFPQYYVLRTEKRIGALGDCTVKKIDDNTYLVTANGANFSIELGR